MVKINLLRFLDFFNLQPGCVKYFDVPHNCIVYWKFLLMKVFALMCSRWRKCPDSSGRWFWVNSRHDVASPLQLIPYVHVALGKLFQDYVIP